MYDYAPLLIGFLNALDARVVLSSQTNNEIMEQAIELGYTDSCFPLKLLHGHAAMLKDVDYILYPCAIRLGRKDGDENQKYSCPLVQASPFIIRNVLDFGERLLIPIIDFSQGDDEVIKNLADVAVKMGFSRKRGKEAALAGIESQRKFEADRAVLGRELLEQLHQKRPVGRGPLVQVLYVAGCRGESGHSREARSAWGGAHTAGLFAPGVGECQGLLRPSLLVL